MAKQERLVKEDYEVCDWCESEIKPIYDDKMMSLWPLVNIQLNHFHVEVNSELSSDEQMDEIKRTLKWLKEELAQHVNNNTEAKDIIHGNNI